MTSEAAAVLRADLDALVEREEHALQRLRGGRIFLTGGTGFVGKWLLESLLHAQERLGLDMRLVVLSRDPADFLARHGRFADAPGITWLRGDIRDFAPPQGEISHAIHAATQVGSSARARETFDVIVEGTRRVLELCERSGVRDVLLVSSGAVYGRQPPEVSRLGEDFPGAPSPTDPRTAYGNGKRAAEWLACAHGEALGATVRIARGFAFAGPYLPLDGPFAIGNFVADRLAGRDIGVQGDGTTVRSYLYAADLARWLLALLLRAPAGAYNVGSEEAISIGALAQRVATVDNGSAAVRTAAAPVAGRPAERYVPDTRKARALGLEPTVSLDESIIRTLAWARARH